MYYVIHVELTKKGISNKSEWMIDEFFSEEDLLTYIRNHLNAWKYKFRRLKLFMYENAKLVGSYEHKYLLDNLLQDVKEDIECR